MFKYLLSKIIEIRRDEELVATQMRKRRQATNRSNKKSSNKNSNYDYESDCEETNNEKTKVAKRHVSMIGKRPKMFASRLVLGLSFTVGVAAFAMYAMNPNKDPQDLFSKVYHLLNYKDFI